MSVRVSEYKTLSFKEFNDEVKHRLFVIVARRNLLGYLNKSFDSFIAETLLDLIQHAEVWLTPLYQLLLICY